MSNLKKLVLILFAIIVVIAGQNMIGNYYSISNSNSQSNGSVVYIENGVSGVVTINDPFLNRTTDINIIYYPLDSGSGFIVNKDGYIVTALHVVSDLDSLNNEKIKIMDNNDIKRYLERAAVTEYILNLNPHLDVELGNNVSGNSNLLHTVMNPNSTTDELVQRNLLSVKSVQQVIKVKLPNVNNGNYNASIVDVGNPVIYEDIALLKVNTSFNNLNSFNISSERPTFFKGLQIYGYPVTNNSNFYNTNNSIISPSKSTGFVTSKTFKNGTNSQAFNSSVYENLINIFMLILNSESTNNDTLYYGTNAKTIQGYSGGPVIDSQNNVIGILIFSVNSDNSFQNQIKLSSSLFLSSEYIIEICKKNNIPINIV